jgi:hypothetical protein
MQLFQLHVDCPESLPAARKGYARCIVASRCKVPILENRGGSISDRYQCQQYSSPREGAQEVSRRKHIGSNGRPQAAVVPPNSRLSSSTSGSSPSVPSQKISPVLFSVCCT